MDSAGLPGWDKVCRLANALLNLNSFVTNLEVENIKRLYADLDEYDRQALKFAPHYRKAKGRFQQSKNRSSPVGVESMSRYVSACSKTRSSSVPYTAYSKCRCII